MDTPAQIVGEPLSPVGRTSLVTLRMHSGICSVCLVHFVPSETTLKKPVLFLVVINITICGDWAGAVYNSEGFLGACADAVLNPSNYDSAILIPAS